MLYSLVFILATQFFVVMLIYQLFDGLQIVLGSIPRGMSDVNIPTLYTFIAYFVVSLPMGYLCAFTFGLNEIVFGSFSFRIWCDL